MKLKKHNQFTLRITQIFTKLLTKKLYKYFLFILSNKTKDIF